MAKQRFIYDSFWTDSYIETLNPQEKLLFIYLLTNPLCNIAGMYEITNKRISYETGLDLKDIEKIKSKFQKDDKLLIFKEWVVIINFIKNQSLNENVKEGMRRIIKSLPEDIKALKGFQSLIKGRRYLTLLNLTILPAKAGVKSMKNYKETEIDFETGETIKEPRKINRSSEAIKLAQLFDKMASEYSKKKIITPKSYFIVINAINKHGLKPKGIIKLYQDWFSNEKIKSEDKVNLSFALSANNINAFKVKN